MVALRLKCALFNSKYHIFPRQYYRGVSIVSKNRVFFIEPKIRVLSFFYKNANVVSIEKGEFFL